MICSMPGISYINPYFLPPSPLKPLKSSPRYQNLPGNHLQLIPTRKTTENDQNRPKTRPKSTHVDLCFLYEPILGALKARFDQLDR